MNDKSGLSPIEIKAHFLQIELALDVSSPQYHKALKSFKAIKTELERMRQVKNCKNKKMKELYEAIEILQRTTHGRAQNVRKNNNRQ